MSPSSTPVAKRVKLDLEDDSLDPAGSEEQEDLADTRLNELDESENSCSICLQPVENRTVIPTCSHEFCFDCILVWTAQSRRCPLCSQAMGEYLIHSIRSRYDYRKHFLAPLRTSPTSGSNSNQHLPRTREPTTRRRNPPPWGRPNRDRVTEQLDRLERSILKRRRIYQHNLYAKHVASNAFTKYRPYPTPSQFAASQDLVSRTTSFLRRELQVWEGLDVEFLTTLILSLMKSIDIRSESAVKLISEFLDMDEPYTPGGRHRNAEHFAHEVYSYVRSPYKDLFVYDDIVQYDGIPHDEPPVSGTRSRGPRDTGQSTELSQPSLSRRDRSPSPSLQLCTPSQSLSRSLSRMRYSPDSGTYPSSSSWHHRNITSDPQDSAHPEPPGINQEAVAQSDKLASSKGKERAIEPGTRLSESSMNIEMPKQDFASNNNDLNDQSVLDIDVPDKPPKIHRPFRNTSLIQSVKAHLSRNAASSSGPEVDSASSTKIARDADPSRSHQQESIRRRTTYPNSDRPPVLLARLSEPMHPALLSRLSYPCSSSNIDYPLPPTHASPSHSSFASDLSVCGAARQLSQNSSATLDQLSERRDSEASTPGPSLSILEARAKLLARLNREKKQVQSPDLSIPESPTLPAYTIPKPPSDPSDSSQQEGGSGTHARKQRSALSPS